MHNYPYVVVSGKKYQATSVQISRSLENLAGSFSCTMGPSFWMELEGDRRDIPITLFYQYADKAEVMATGYVTSFQRSRTPGIGISLNCSDKPIDLATCTGKTKNGTYSWNSISHEQAVQELCDPFDIYVDPRIDETANLKAFKFQPQDTIASILKKMAGIGKYLIFANRFGDLVMDATVSEDTIPVANLFDTDDDRCNIKTITEDVDFSKLHSTMQLTSGNNSKAAGKGSKSSHKMLDSKSNKKTAGRIWSKLLNTESIERWRPLIKKMGGLRTSEDINQRAVYEMQKRESMHRQYTVVVTGVQWNKDPEASAPQIQNTSLSYDTYRTNPDATFTQEYYSAPTFHPWEVNTNVTLLSESYNIEDTFTILSFTTSINAQGSVTTLKLGDPKAFEYAPPAKEISGPAVRLRSVKERALGLASDPILRDFDDPDVVDKDTGQD